MYVCMYGGAKIKHVWVFFVLRVCGAYIWRGLYMEGLIFQILRCFVKKI